MVVSRLCSEKRASACCNNVHVQVEVTIDNRYNTYSFDGTKSIVLANTSWLGGHNIFLGTGEGRIQKILSLRTHGTFDKP